jgi:hypothetical protein
MGFGYNYEESKPTGEALKLDVNVFLTLSFTFAVTLSFPSCSQLNIRSDIQF